MEQTKEINIIRINSGFRDTEKDMVIMENPFTIMVNGQELVTLLCSPRKLEYLTAGFLLSEGLIKSNREIKNIVLGKDGHYVNVELEDSFQIPQDFSRKRLISSGCGKGISFYDPRDVMDCQPVDSKTRINHDEIFRLMKELQRKSSLFKATGGVHSAALCNQAEIEIFAEDIGRHNAIDKIFGECLLKDISTEDKVVLTSGRVSSEILIKVVKRKVPVIISRAAPTDLAVGIAEKMGITLIGFVRGNRMNVYSQPFRISK